MNTGKKRSGFQITSVTSDLNQAPASRSSPSVLLTTFQSEASSSYSRHGSSSQPTSPSLKRKHISHDAPGQGAGSSSRFRVVRLAAGGSGGRGRGESYRRGRWMCMDFTERQEGMGFRRVMDSMRHAHSLESLEMIGQDKDRGRGYFSRIRGDTAHLLTLPIKGREGARPASHSGPPSPTPQEPINSQLLDHEEAKKAPLSPRQRQVPPPIRLVTAGQTPATFSLDQAPFSLDQAIFSLPGDSSTRKWTGWTDCSPNTRAETLWKEGQQVKPA
ncbi:TSC22 domain family protein 4-like isoform X2 [Parambassis ranga]|uniref:TSC22 domain family protein 4-like isoform X2 n=1 Tax=Parambassis ranga TaxID=210632 RepID=A0A6P7HRJ5_9TELE|nr:TSC22 domain family protein 4-like isoform X2 [Parambassis ranga]